VESIKIPFPFFKDHSVFAAENIGRPGVEILKIFSITASPFVRYLRSTIIIFCFNKGSQHSL